MKSRLSGPNVKSRPTVVDLFCGAGGLSAGFQLAGFETIAGIDSDYDSIQTLIHNHRHAIGLQANIQDVTNEEFLKIIGDQEVDVLVGSPPCQGFTNIGMPKLRSLGQPRKVNTSRNRLYKEFIRFVLLLRPRFFVMENVKGMLAIENGRIQRDIYTKLGEHYRIDILYKDAADYGVPQHRKRIFIVGNSLGLDNPDPKPTHFDASKTSIKNGRRLPYITTRDAISDLPKVMMGSDKNAMKYRAKPKSDYQKARRRWSSMVYNHVARTHCEKHVALFKILKQGDWSARLPNNLHPYRKDIFQDRIKRQQWQCPSSTIIAHIHKDGLMFIHPEQLRTFTPREAARIQSFDDRYFFVGSQTSIYRQIGNAVPPLMGKAIAKDIIKLLRLVQPVAVYNHR